MKSTGKLARCALVVAALMCVEMTVLLAAPSAAHATDATDDMDAKKKKKKKPANPQPTQPPNSTGSGPCTAPGCGPYGPPYTCIGGVVNWLDTPEFCTDSPDDDEE